MQTGFTEAVELKAKLIRASIAVNVSNSITITQSSQDRIRLRSHRLRSQSPFFSSVSSARDWAEVYSCTSAPTPSTPWIPPDWRSFWRTRCRPVYRHSGSPRSVYCRCHRCVPWCTTWHCLFERYRENSWRLSLDQLTAPCSSYFRFASGRPSC